MNDLLCNNPNLLQKLDAIKNARGEALAQNPAKPVVSSAQAVKIILTRWRQQPDRRLVAAIAGFSAGGKTTIAKAMVLRINASCGREVAANLPMDGYHFSNSRLAAEGLESIKGDIITFDIAGYAEKMAEFKRSAGASILAPDYIREEHEVFKDKIEIAPDVRILVTEGIYAGYREIGWDAAAKLLDVLFYLDASPEECADRIVARNLQAGRSESLIAHKLSNDFGFMARSIEILPWADYILREPS